MADHLPRSSCSVQEFEVISGRNILDKLRDGNLNTGAASRKRRKMSVKYHNKDIEECFIKVRRLSNNPTITDLENSLDETQGTPRKKKFDELEDEIIRLEDGQTNLHQFIESEKQHGNEMLLRVIQSKNEDMIRYSQEKDEESARKDEINRSLQRENNRKEEINRRLQRENNRKEEINRRLEEKNNKKEEINRKLEEENNRNKEIIRRLIEENNRKEEIIRRLED